MTAADWKSAAACKGKPLSWFVPDGAERPPDEAYALCESCPVQAACSTAGEGHIGLWGGRYRKERPGRSHVVEFRCERCDVPVVIEKPSGQLRRCGNCLVEDPETRNVATKRRSRARVARRRLDGDVVAFERSVAELVVEWERLEA